MIFLTMIGHGFPVSQTFPSFYENRIQCQQSPLSSSLRLKLRFKRLSGARETA